MIQSLEKMDFNILKYITDHFHNVALDKVMPIITYLGNGGLIWIILSIVLMINNKYRKIGFLTLCSMVLGAILGEVILKQIFHRSRPFIELPGLELLIKKPLTYSFPSGHTLSAFAAAGVIGGMIKKFKQSVMILAILIAFSRLYLFVHYPSDILVGMVLGLLCAKIVLFFSRKMNRGQSPMI